MMKNTLSVQTPMGILEAKVNWDEHSSNIQVTLDGQLVSAVEYNPDEKAIKHQGYQGELEEPVYNYEYLKDEDEEGIYQAYIKNITTDEWLMQQEDMKLAHTKDESKMIVFCDEIDAESTLEYLNLNFSDSYVLLREDDKSKLNK